MEDDEVDSLPRVMRKIVVRQIAQEGVDGEDLHGWLSASGSPYIVRERQALARDIRLFPCTTPIESPPTVPRRAGWEVKALPRSPYHSLSGYSAMTTNSPPFEDIQPPSKTAGSVFSTPTPA